MIQNRVVLKNLRAEPITLYSNPKKPYQVIRTWLFQEDNFLPDNKHFFFPQEHIRKIPCVIARGVFCI